MYLRVWTTPKYTLEERGTGEPKLGYSWSAIRPWASRLCKPRDSTLVSTHCSSLGTRCTTRDTAANIVEYLLRGYRVLLDFPNEKFSCWVAQFFQVPFACQTLFTSHREPSLWNKSETISVNISCKWGGKSARLTMQDFCEQHGTRSIGGTLKIFRHLKF